MANQIQQQTISQTGSTLTDEKVEHRQNATDRTDAILTFQVPDYFSSVDFVGHRDATRFIPRTMQEETGTAGDDTVITLDSDIRPVAGETEIDDQDYPAVIAVNATQATEVDITAIDYGANEVTLADDPADGDTVKLYPILIEGSIQFQGRNQFGQVEGVAYEWSQPLYPFHDFHQLKRGTEIHMKGAIEWDRHETMEVLLDSPHQIQWTDPDYPEKYVSTFEQDVEISL